MDTERTPQTRRWNRGGFPTWAKMLVAVAVVLLFSLVFFRVKTFTVTGNVRYTADQVAEASGITKGDILMAVNKTRTASRLLVKLPYIEEVRVYKEMPGTVRFEVKECSAVMAAKSEFSTYWLMTEDGKLLEEVDSREDPKLSGIPVIEGVNLSLPTLGQQAVFDDVLSGKTAMELIGAISDAGLLGSVSELNLEDPSNITLQYGNDLAVWLGDGSDGAYKLQYLLAVQAQLTAGKRGVLDLSFSSGQQAVFHPLT